MIVTNDCRRSLGVDNLMWFWGHRLLAVRPAHKVEFSIIFRKGRVPHPRALFKGAGGSAFEWSGVSAVALLRAFKGCGSCSFTGDFLPRSALSQPRERKGTLPGVGSKFTMNVPGVPGRGARRREVTPVPHSGPALDARGRWGYRFAAKVNLKSEIPPKIPTSRFPKGTKHADTKARRVRACRKVVAGGALRGIASRGTFPTSASPACGHVKCGSGR